MQANFLIENGWYMVEDTYSWNLGRLDEKSGRFKDLTYHATPEQAIAHYLKYRRSEALHEAAHGTIQDVLDILTRENERLLSALLSAFTAGYKAQPAMVPEPTEDDLDALDEDDLDDQVDEDLDEL